MSTTPSSRVTPASPVTPDRKPIRPKPIRRRVRVAIALIATVVIGLAMFLIVRIQGYVSGEEFSPVDFQQRHFSFYEIPLIHVQITPIRRVGTTTSTARYLRRNSLLTTPPPTAATWHLVKISRRIVRSTPGDAELLTDQLTFRRDGDPHWKRWSQEHPDQARIFWPVIQRLANRELYILMPELFERAQRSTSADSLQASIDEFLRQEYHELVDEMRAAGRQELAEQLSREAAEDYPDRVDEATPDHADPQPS